MFPEVTAVERVRALRFYAEQNARCAEYWRKRPPSDGDTYQLERHARQACELYAKADQLEKML